MIRIYAVNTDQLEESLLRETYHRMPLERRTKTDSYRQEMDKKRSIAAFYLLEKAWMEHQKSGTQEELQLAYSEFGKPYLPDFPEFHFSISHSGKIAVCASCETGEIGIDIQLIKEIRLGLAERFFTKLEREELEELPLGKERDRQFAKIWTMKESYLKYSGRGMRVELSKFYQEQHTGWILEEQQRKAYVSHFENFEGYLFAVCQKDSEEECIFIPF